MLKKPFFMALLSLYALISVEAHAINVAAFGDSITRGWNYETDDANGRANNGGYIPGLQSQLNQNNWGSGSSVTVYNWGHPGEYVHTEGQNRFPSPVLNNHPDYVLILEGTNDLALGWEGPSTISNSLNAIVLAVIADGGVPMIGTMLPRFDNKASDSSIRDLNDHIRTNAAVTNTDVAEFYSASSNWNSLMWDGLHPNLTGYSLMADVWFDTMQRYKETQEKIAEEKERARIAASLQGPYLLLLLSD
jgi:lysophospholipase L1-like esterase